MSDPAHNVTELMICAASHMLEDRCTISVGTGAPCAAAMLAQKTHAPNLTIFFEAGGIAPILPEMPISVGDSRTFARGVMASGMCDIMETCQRGLVDYTFLGGAQIDMYGNLNSTVIGEHGRPRVRLPGSGGANDFASFCWRTMVITPQDRRRFTNDIDFVTTPGYLRGGTSREEAGLPPGTGPYRVITDMAIMDFAPGSRRMRVISVHPGRTIEEVLERCGFELLVADRLEATPPPDVEELAILREVVDPRRYIIGRG
jgi:glutaconate CoA-transferase subunit B